jgi:hypothetical protein
MSARHAEQPRAPAEPRSNAAPAAPAAQQRLEQPAPSQTEAHRVLALIGTVGSISQRYHRTLKRLAD